MEWRRLLVEWIEKIVEGISGVDKENSGGVVKWIEKRKNRGGK